MNELPEKDPCEIVSVRYTAGLLGVTTRSIRRWCESGKLKATLLGREYAILWRDFVVFWNEYQSKK